MAIDTQYIVRCINSLEKAFDLLQQYDQQNTLYDVYRSATIKEFEIILEQSAKLLRKRLRVFFHSNKAVDALTFKDIFRQAGKHTLLDINEVERWLQYRDNRNETAHNYGLGWVNHTLRLMPQFITDAKALVQIIQQP